MGAMTTQRPLSRSSCPLRSVGVNVVEFVPELSVDVAHLGGVLRGDHGEVGHPVEYAYDLLGVPEGVAAERGDVTCGDRLHHGPPDHIEGDLLPRGELELGGPEGGLDDEEVAVDGPRRLHGVAVPHADVPGVEDCALRCGDLVLDAAEDVARVEGPDLDLPDLHLVPDGDLLPVVEPLIVEGLEEPVGGLSGVLYGLGVLERGGVVSVGVGDEDGEVCHLSTGVQGDPVLPVLDEDPPALPNG